MAVRCRIMAMHIATRSDSVKLVRAVATAAAFAALVAGAALLVLFEVGRNGNVVENGPVELTQIAVLAAASLAYGLRASASNTSRRGPTRALVLCALLVLAMAVRELDGFLDLAFFHGAWCVIDGAVIAAFLCVLMRRPAESAHDLADFAAGPECPMLLAGIAFALLFAQALGYKGLWKHVFDVPIWTDTVAPLFDETGHLPAEINIVRHVKNIVEESFELACYLLVLASAVLPPALVDRRAGPQDRQTV